jgi:hypothetical protein
MSKRFNNRTLLIVFVVLLGIFLVSKFFFSDRKERNFRTDLVTLDTAQVTNIQIYPKDEEKITLQKESGQWTVQQGSISSQADQSAVMNLLTTLEDLKPQRLAATSKEQWSALDITDSAATRVVVAANGKEVADVYIGKFSINASAQQPMNPMQQQRQMPSATSFVRVGNEEEVYAIDGYQTMSINRGFSSWRDRTFIKLDQDNISQLAFTYAGDSSFTAAKTADAKWVIDGVQADSSEMVNYLRTISNLTNSNFADNFAAEGQNPLCKLAINGEDMEQVTIDCYRSDNGFVLTSTQRDRVYFSSDSSGVFSRVFVSKGELMPEEEEEAIQ